MTERFAARRFTVESVAPLVAPHATTVESVVTRSPSLSRSHSPSPRSLFSGGCGRDGDGRRCGRCGRCRI